MTTPSDLLSPLRQRARHGPRAAGAGRGARGPLWRQLPVHSPLTLRAAWRATAPALGLRDDPRPRIERLLSVRYCAEDAVLVGSGTQALQLAIRVAARAVSEPCTVALPAFSCYDVAAAAVAAGVRIALYDVDPGTLAPDLDSVVATLAQGARVVVVAPLYGVPVDWGAIEQCVNGFGAIAIEDAAQGHGASWRGKPLGSFGALSVLSFGRGKGWTGGRGGTLLVRQGTTDGDSLNVAPTDLADEVAVLCTALAQYALGRPAIYRLPAAIPWLHLGETRYRDPDTPHRMSRAAASLLECMLTLATREAGARRANAHALLASIPLRSRVRTVTPPAAATAGFVRLPLRLPRGVASFEDPGMALRLGVAPGYPTTLAALAPVRERLARPGGRWPGAEDLVRELVTLPTHSLVNAAEREALARMLEGCA